MIFVLMGCATWFDEGTACEYASVYTWSDDLLAHVLQGEGDGQFDYDPADVPRERLSGSYDLDSGEFDWEVEYDSDYFLTETQVEGYGTAYHNGDLDLSFIKTNVDVLEASTAFEYRVLRDGCDVTIASWDAEEGDIDSAFVQEGEYASESLLQWEASDAGYDYQGTLRDNLSRSMSVTAQDDSYASFRQERPDGTANGWWTGACGSDLACEVSFETAFDGDREESWEIFADGEEIGSGSGEFDYDGSGTLELDWGDAVCTYEYASDGDCTYACDDGEDGEC